jgi:assimilatory nitrate reductase catalytic subunit
VKRGADWEIVVDFARRLGARLEQPLTGELFPYASPEAIFNEHRESTRGRDLDITGLSYALLDSADRSNGRSPKARAAVAGVSTPTASSRLPPVAPASSPSSTGRPPRALTTRTRSAFSPAACATSGMA